MSRVSWVRYSRRVATPRILLVFAHPDDETFMTGGVCRRYADAGADIALVTATRGDAGRMGEPALCTREELAQVREAELARATARLGISKVRVLDYRDKHLVEAPAARIRDELVVSIRRHRPHLVVTFDPNGLNDHPDHVAIARFTMDAVAAAADPRLPSEVADAHPVQRLLWSAPIAPWKVTESADLTQEPGVDFVIDTTASRAAKAEALRCHRTQQVPIDRCFFSRGDVERVLSVEVFRQAWGPPLPDGTATDLLVGLDLS